MEGAHPSAYFPLGSFSWLSLQSWRVPIILEMAQTEKNKTLKRSVSKTGLCCRLLGGEKHLLLNCFFVVTTGVTHWSSVR